MTWQRVTGFFWLTAALSVTLGYAQSLTMPISQMISPDQIDRQDLEPAVAEQIGTAYEEALRRPEDAEAVGKLGMIFQCYGKYELAEICYRQARALAQNSFRWAYYLGNVEGWLGKYREALDHIREALRLQGVNAAAHLRLAQLLFESGDLEQSEKIYLEAIAQNAGLAPAHLGLGRVLSARGNWSGAIERYRRACDLSENYASARYALAMAYAKTGETAKAQEQLDTYQRVRQLAQPSEDPLMDAVKSLYAGGLSHVAKGSAFAQQGKILQAIGEFEAALAVNPRLMMAHVNLIAMYGQLDRPDRAAEHFREAVKLDSGWVETYYNWGFFLFHKGRTAEAEAAFRKALTIDPGYADANVELGNLLDQAGQLVDAQRHYRAALDTNPRHRRAQYLLGHTLVRTGQLHEAITHLLETIKVEDEKTPLCLQTLAAAYERTGDRVKALYYLREALQRAAARHLGELADRLQRDLARLQDQAEPR